MTKSTFKITGMDCPSCAKSVETGISQLAGIESCELNFTTEKLKITGQVDHQTVINRVRELGYDVADTANNEISNSALPVNFLQFMWQRFDTRLALFGGVLILPGLIFSEIAGVEHWLINIASVAAMLIAGYPIARSAWQSVRISHEININALMTIAAIGAVIIGAYTEAGMVIVLFALGEALEGYTASRARDSIRTLMELQPNEATRLTRHDDHTHEERVNVKKLQIGDLIVVKPGEVIPMDGTIRAGGSLINQAPITGESKLVEKTVSSLVFASSINGEGVLEIEVTHLASDNTISRLIKMVEEAQEKRAPSQRFIDQFAKYYTPAVVIMAILVATVPPVLFGQPFWNPQESNAETFGWFYRGLALLVVACPCALVISTPVSLISGISNAARRGVLIKGGAYLETLSRVQAIAFDKTGTLTTGRPNLVALRSATCESIATGPIGVCSPCNEVLALATAIERRSEHPVALAIINEATERGLLDKYPAGQMVKAIIGKGIVGEVNGQKVMVGSHTYFDATIPHPEQDCLTAETEARLGHTTLMVEMDGIYMGTITVADTVRKSSREAIAMLKRIGVKQLVMLTGDNQMVAEAIAKEVGLTDVKAELLPENKVAAVRSLQQKYGRVAMVGDGINDAPALATADVGIAIGGAGRGTTQAMETADITLMSDDLRQLAFAVSISRATMQTVYFNVFLSIAIKVVFLIIVLIGWGTMWMAVLADVGTSLLVTLNGMRLLKYSPK
jgi:Cd2+/Zn2+-exporting ATPase